MRQGLRDLQKVRTDIEQGYFEWACFTAQQAAEKSLKALFQHLHGQAWGHNLTDLLRVVPPAVSLPAEVLHAARRLDRLYIPTRYPDGLPSGTPHEYYDETDATEAERDAGTIIQFCQSLLP